MFQHRRRWNFGAPVLDPVVDTYGPKDVRRKRHGARRDVEGVLLRIFGDLFLFPCPVPVNNIVPIYAGRVAGLVARFAAARKRGFKVVEKDKGSKGEEDERELSSGWWCRPRHECTRHKFYYLVVTLLCVYFIKMDLVLVVRNSILKKWNAQDICICYHPERVLLRDLCRWNLRRRHTSGDG